MPTQHAAIHFIILHGGRDKVPTRCRVIKDRGGNSHSAR